MEDEANHVHGDGLPVDHEDMLTVVPVTDAEVLKVFPEYWQWDKWLKENGKILMALMPEENG